MIHDSAVTTYKNPERAPWALGNFVVVTDPRLADARVPRSHTHVVGEVAGASAIGHTHVVADITGLTDSLATIPARGEYHICLALSETEVTF